jgi:hypothetical protein
MAETIASLRERSTGYVADCDVCMNIHGGAEFSIESDSSRGTYKSASDA